MIKKNKIIKKFGKKGSIAISQVVLLVLSIVAFSYMLGSSLPLVSTQAPGKTGEGPPPISFPKIMTDAALYLGLKELTATSNTAAKIAFDQVIAAGGTEEAAKVAAKAAAEKSAATATSPGFFESFFRPDSILDGVLNAGITAVVVAAITFLYVGISTGNWEKAGYAAARTAIGAAVGYGVAATVAALGGPAGWVAAGIISVFVWLSGFLVNDTDRQITFLCKPWQAQKGGKDCLLCNDGKFPCTEYQCKSLGTGCDLINKDSDEPRCIWKDQRDTNPPNITAWIAALPQGYNYTPLPRGQYGVEIKYGNAECLPAFQEFTFGVELDKNGYCRLEFKSTKNFSEMKNDFGGSNLYTKQHKQLMSFPGKRYLEEELKNLGLPLNITNDGKFEVYVRCESASNNVANREEFLFKFCIDPEDDTTAPIIRGFNWQDRSPISFFNENETRQVGINAYVNKPSQCKWDHEDKEYKDMENNLSCASRLINLNAQLSYTCSGNLTGLENNKENDFYFRCNDTLGNFNRESKKLTLIGTQKLYISSTEPNGTIKGASNSIQVTLKAETSAGYENGKAECSWSKTGTSGSYINKFTNTKSYKHSTNIWLGPGNYNYFIRCFDLAGNSDTKELNFTIETDTQAPAVVRAFHESNYLKIITNEKAECVYDTVKCNYNFDDGISMTTTNNKDHFTNWNTNLNFYIKCKDEYGNQPDPNQCSIEARPSNL